MAREDISENTIRRLTKYLAFARSLGELEWTHVSSADIARGLELDALVVRKDLSIAGVSGRRNYGYPIKSMVERIKEVIGWSSPRRVAFIGEAGVIDSLISAFPFDKYNLLPVAVVEIGACTIPESVGGVPAMTFGHFLELQKADPVRLVVFAVPISRAQTTANRLVESGVTAFWNFTEDTITVPEGVHVVDSSMVGDLAMLSFLTK